MLQNDELYGSSVPAETDKLIHLQSLNLFAIENLYAHFELGHDLFRSVRKMRWRAEVGWCITQFFGQFHTIDQGNALRQSSFRQHWFQHSQAKCRLF